MKAKIAWLLYDTDHPHHNPELLIQEPRYYSGKLVQIVYFEVEEKE